MKEHDHGETVFGLNKVRFGTICIPSYSICTHVEAGINSVFNLSDALLIDPTPLRAAANNPGPNTPEVP